MSAHSIQNLYTEKKILFQKIGPRWYLFSEKSGNIIYSEMPLGLDPRKTKLELYDIIEDHIDKVENFGNRSKEVSL